MKKLVSVALVLAVVTALFAGCSAPAAETATKTVRVGASPSPHAEILEIAKAEMEKAGYTLEIIEFTDYVQPNLTLEDGSIDANYFQHKPYLEDFNANNGTHIVSAADIHYEPLGLYAGKAASIDALADGATIGVPNDTTNEARALLLLETVGLIKLNPDAGLLATKLDIVENPKNLNILEVEAAQLPRSLPDIDMAVINGNYAIDAGLDVNNALAMEEKDSVAAERYSNIVAVKEGNENDEGVQALITALKSDAVKTYIENTYNGAVVPMF